MFTSNKIIISLFLVAGVIALFSTSKSHPMVLSEKDDNSQKFVIAACPSCYELALKLDPDLYTIVKTGSTSESLALLEAGKVDSIFAGRTLKPGEPQLEAHVVKEGFSFLSSSEITISKRELNNHIIYTDLETEQLKSELGLNNITHVEDVYNYLNKGVVITTWENTDYSKANIVHVIEDDGQRLALSRRPTLYCSSTCDPRLLSDISSL
ncbi:MAG: hypothetical protein PHX84_02120 [Candidatus Shapirobacteria bacterium]|nr:hypothetical protein [Candidatus Shapirobacteria bacterium]